MKYIVRYENFNEDKVKILLTQAIFGNPETRYRIRRSTRHIADKIADIMKLKKDVLFNMLTEGANGNYVMRKRRKA